MSKIPESDILRLIERMLKFPYPTVCRHMIAADLLSLLEANGFPVSQELAIAVVYAYDEEALELLNSAKVQ